MCYYETVLLLQLRILRLQVVSYGRDIMEIIFLQWRQTKELFVVSMKIVTITYQLRLQYIMNSSSYKVSEHNNITPSRYGALACRPEAVGRWVV